VTRPRAEPIPKEVTAAMDGVVAALREPTDRFTSTAAFRVLEQMEW
jgi:hypothetical protein